MVSGCSSKKEYELVSPVSTSSASNKVDDSVDYSSFYNTKIEISNDTNLYDESNNVVGTLLQGSYLDIDEGNENLLSIKDTDYKVDGKDVQVSNRWFKNTNHLVPYNEELITNSNYSLQDVKEYLFSHQTVYGILCQILE